MTDFLFNGYYGYRNVGDDAFCVVADWGSRKYWGARSLAFFARELPRLGTPATCVIPVRKRFVGHGTVAASAAALAARRLVYFGGSTLHSPQDHWVSIFSHARLRSVLGKQMAAVGVSIGPFKSAADEAVIHKLLRQMCFISVRDRASLDILKGMNLDVPVVKAFDPAVLLPDVLRDRAARPVFARGRRKVLGLSICGVERHAGGNLQREQQRLGTIIAALRRLPADEVTLRFFEFNGHAESGDAAVTQEVIAALDGHPHIERVPYDPDPLVVLEQLRHCDAVFGVRLHAAILAYTAEVPFLLVEYHRKCADFLDEIACAQAHRIGDAEASDSQIAARLEAMLFARAPAPAGQLSLSAARTLALKNFTAAPFHVPSRVAVAAPEFS